MIDLRLRRSDPDEHKPLTSPSERARNTRDRASFAVFTVSAFAVGSAASSSLHHWVSIGDGQVKVLATAAGLAGGLVILKTIGRIFPWIFRATRWERG